MLSCQFQNQTLNSIHISGTNQVQSDPNVGEIGVCVMGWCYYTSQAVFTLTRGFTYRVTMQPSGPVILVSVSTLANRCTSLIFYLLTYLFMI